MAFVNKGCNLNTNMSRKIREWEQSQKNVFYMENFVTKMAKNIKLWRKKLDDVCNSHNNGLSECMVCPVMNALPAPTSTFKTLLKIQLEWIHLYLTLTMLCKLCYYYFPNRSE